MLICVKHYNYSHTPPSTTLLTMVLRMRCNPLLAYNGSVATMDTQEVTANKTSDMGQGEEKVLLHHSSFFRLTKRMKVPDIAGLHI